MNTKYLERNIDKALAEWKKSSEHKPKKSPFGIRTSLENFCEYQDIKVYPLYAAGNIVKS